MAEATKSRVLALFLELGVVFLGVFIALAADSWSQSRQEARRELAYIQALQRDVIEAQGRVALAIEETSVFLKEAEVFLNLLRSDAPMPDSTSIARLNISPMTLPMGTLDALLETGDVNLLSHEGLRATIINQRSEIGTWLSLIEQFNVTVLANVARQSVAVEEISSKYRDAAEPMPLVALRESPTFIAAYEIHRNALNNHLGFMNSINRSLTTLELSVSEALGGGQ